MYQSEDKDEAANATFAESEEKYYSTLKEINEFDRNEVIAITGASTEVDIATVGAGVSGEFTNTHELHVMKNKEAIQTNKQTKDKENWAQVMQEELQRFKDNDVFDVVE